MVELRKFQTEPGGIPFDAWMARIDLHARIRIARRLDRVTRGNFGDHKRLSHGVSELRIDYGPGYRVYYGQDGQHLVILLGGGTKKRQSAAIQQAQTYWNHYKREKRYANRAVRHK